MKPFRATKKPVTIDAILWDGKNLSEVLEFTGKCDDFEYFFKTFSEYENYVHNHNMEFKIFTLEGVMAANVGDYVIRGVNGEYYPCKPDIFLKTYDVQNE